jgi:hypothetical protein
VKGNRRNWAEGKHELAAGRKAFPVSVARPSTIPARGSAKRETGFRSMS